MRKLYIIALFFVGLTCNAQNFGKYKIDVEGAYNSTSPRYEKWLRDPSGFITMKFKLNPMGFKHAIEEVDRILEVNNMFDAEPYFDDTTQGSDIKDDESPEEWHKSIMNGNSEVRKGFQYLNENLLQIFLTSDGYELNIM